MSQPFPGGGLNFTPLYYPPVSVKWIITGLIVFMGAVANKIQHETRAKFAHPFGFFLTSLAALAMFQLGFPPAAFAILFFLLMVWSAEMYESREGFLNGSPAIDWVQHSKRWFVERVLKERPSGIQERTVITLPVQGS